MINFSKTFTIEWKDPKDVLPLEECSLKNIICDAFVVLENDNEDITVTIIQFQNTDNTWRNFDGSEYPNIHHIKFWCYVPDYREGTIDEGRSIF